MPIRCYQSGLYHRAARPITDVTHGRASATDAPFRLRHKCKPPRFFLQLAYIWVARTRPASASPTPRPNAWRWDPGCGRRMPDSTHAYRLCLKHTASRKKIENAPRREKKSRTHREREAHDRPYHREYRRRRRGVSRRNDEADVGLPKVARHTIKETIKATIITTIITAIITAITATIISRRKDEADVGLPKVANTLSRRLLYRLLK